MVNHHFQWNIQNLTEHFIQIFKSSILCIRSLFIFTEIDECLSSPCVNDATCTDSINTYTCICADGYTGTHCESGMSYLHISVYISIINLLVCIPHGCIFVF